MALKRRSGGHRLRRSALAQRLAQNGVQEKLTALWIWRCLNQLPPERKAA